MTKKAAGDISPARTTQRRRRVLVKRGFQIKYAVIITALFGTAAFMVWWEIYHSFRTLIAQGLIQDPVAIKMASQVSHAVLNKVMVALAIVWFLCIFLSHYLAGPIYRLEVCFNLLRAGDLRHRARLRSRDELKGLAANYNEALDALQSRMQALKEAASRGAIDKIKAIMEEFKV